MQAGSNFMRVLRAEAPTLTRLFFDCQRPCQSRSPHLTARSAFSKQTCALSRTAVRPLSCRTPARCPSVRAFSLSARRRAEPAATKIRPKTFFPKRTSNTVGYWLLGSAASVFGIVIFGGLTRLTESGLSITEWRPVTGSLPPMSAADWESEFLKYKSSPEFAMLNSRMTLEEFKNIYWMEWIHRLWGRAIGITFLLPAIYFTARRSMSARMTATVWGIGGLIGFQGFLGWWMVKSGLKDDLFAPGSTPRVSQYRLTAHLGAAFVVYLSMLWNGLSVLRDNKLIKGMTPRDAAAAFQGLIDPRLRSFRIVTLGLLALTFTTAMSGALVAGLDAGLIYNEFPWMGLGLTPPKSELFDNFYSHVPADENGKHSDLVWRNMFENPSLVQLDHRIMATTTFTAIVALFAWTRFSPKLVRALPPSAKKAVHGVLGFASLQVILGISTLLYLVPTTLASAHQAGALALLTWTTVMASRVHMSRNSLRLLESVAKTRGLGNAQLVKKQRTELVAKAREAMSNLPTQNGLSAAKEKPCLERSQPGLFPADERWSVVKKKAGLDL